MSRRKLSPRTIASAFALAAFTLLPTGLVPSARAQVNPQNASPAATSAAVQASAAVTAQTARITTAIDDAVRVPLKGNVHPLAQARYDQGAAPASMPTGRLSLLLAPSTQQQQALKEYLDSLQNPASPNYHKWLTPAQYGASYGASEADIATVSAWLNGQGFKVEKVAAARNIIQFSGSVAQVTATFHTPIHSFLVNGQRHYANTVDPQIPAALAPVVAAISPLHDFHPRSHSHVAGTGTYDPATSRFHPNLTLFSSSNVPTLFVGPADAAVIYNSPNPTLNPGYSGTKYDGTGVTIGIAGDSDFTSQDVLNYRTLFLNDTNAAHVPTTIVDGNDPGITGDEIEALLDTEVMGALAPGAQINFYTSADTNLAAGLDLAIQRALDDNVVSILNVSFGLCEAQLGNNGNQFYGALWEQAAAQGITPTVSTGDTGSAGCDDPNSETVATLGLAVSGLASTPYNIAVGGTDYLLTQGNFGNYVEYQSGSNYTSGQAPYYGTALSYIPETPWNDSINTYGSLSQNTALLMSNVSNISGAGGGESGFYTKPSYQSALTPNDGGRDIPDVSLLAANGLNGALWTLCADKVATGNTTGATTDCVLTNGALTSSTQIEGIGGTSAAAPAFAGMLALVTQSLGAGTRLGQANDTLYKLAANNYGTVFHDVTQGNNSVVCRQGTANCALDSANQYFMTGYNAGTGYDLASGLGSVNVANMVADWSNAGLASSAVSLMANGAVSALSITHGQNINFAVTVTPNTATGDISIKTTSGLANNGVVAVGTLSNAATTVATNGLPGGAYTVYAYYGGNTALAGATSNSIAVTVAKESSTTALSVQVVDPASNKTYTSSTIPYGYYAYANAQPYGNASNGNTIFDGTPTGTVNFSGIPSSTSVSINSIGAAQVPLATLAPGSYSVTAAYSGDVSFNPSTSSAQSFTIAKGMTSLALTTATATTAVAKPFTKADSGSPLQRLYAAGGGLALSCLLLLSVPARRRAWRSMVAMLVVVVGVSAIGCGGSSSTPKTTPGTGTYTVTATLETDSLGAYPTGAITLNGNGSTFVATSTTNGSLTDGTIAIQAIFSVSGAQLAAGANTLTASYAGDTNYNSSSSTTSLTAAHTGIVQSN